ncbi:MAG: hypothetical protein IT381_02915 [Deltaproteobacteria bacterium]|nr:hypothetical protein [Deltaproteobacteria bacterium]
MAKDDDLDAWDDAMGEAEAPKIGANKELLRKAMALNPALRNGAVDSTVLLDQLQQAKSGQAVKGAPGQKGQAVPNDARSLTEVVRELKQELEEKKKAIAAERAALDQRERELRPALCDRFIDAVLDIDPNMTSPKTAYLLKQEKPFLDNVGFNTQKLVERESKKR